MAFFSAWFLSALLTSIPMAEDMVWQTALQQAKEKSVETGRPMLIAFLGPDWCSCSDEFEETVLNQEAFICAMRDQVILTRINISENFTQDGFEGDQWEIQTCPTLLLLTPEGDEVARFTPTDVSPPSLAKQILETIDDYTQLSNYTKHRGARPLRPEALQALYEKALSLADETLSAQILEEGIKRDRSPYFLLEQYGRLAHNPKFEEKKLRKLRHQIAKRDPENKLGCHREMALIDFAALTQTNVKKTNQVVIKPLVEYLDHFGNQDRENAWLLEMKISQYLFSHNDAKEALKHAQASLKMAPLSAQEEVRQSINYLQKSQ